MNAVADQIKLIIERIRSSTSGLNTELDKLLGAQSGESQVLKIDDQLTAIMTATQGAIEIAGDNGLLFTRLSSALAAADADAERIDGLAPTDDMRRQMQNKIQQEREAIQNGKDQLAKVLQNASGQLHKLIQLRPQVAWWARRQQADLVVSSLQPLVEDVNRLAESLQSLSNFAAQPRASLAQ